MNNNIIKGIGSISIVEIAHIYSGLLDLIVHMWFLSDPKNYYTIHKDSLLIYPPSQTLRVQASNKNAKV